MSMTEKFNDRADECIWLSRQAKTAHDQELFSELALAWCGLGNKTKEIKQTESAAMVRRSPFH
jgi:hypothetical protein